MTMTVYRMASIATLIVGIGSNTALADWPSWRGAFDIGSIDEGTFPVNFDAKSNQWKAPLPGKGCSTPIVLNESIFVTAPADGSDAILCFDFAGTEKWRRTFGPERVGKHRNGSGSNASPVSDGSGVFVYFKSGTLAALELDGSVRWTTNLVDRFGKDTLFWDHGTSPVLTKKYLVMARMQAGESWVAAFDKNSGDIAWKVDRTFSTPVEGDHGYATPLVIEHAGREAVLVWGAAQLTMHDSDDGHVTWSCGNFNPEEKAMWPSIATPVIVGDMVVIAYGRNDRGQPRLHGIRLAGSGDVTATSHVWKREDIGTFVPTPVAYQGRVYLVGDRGEVQCIDPKTGTSLWTDAFPRSRVAFYASPLIAGGIMYAPREDGLVFVASVKDDKFKLLATNDMQESVIGSPVPTGNRILIRGEKNLFCAAAP